MPDNPHAELVVVFSPHPDDDVIACGGTIVKRVAEGHRVKIVVSTDGAMSHAAVLGIHEDPTPQQLVEIRAKEAVAAAAAMGVRPEDVHLLGFPDTDLAGSMPAFREAVLAFLATVPEVAEVYVPHDVREMNADHRLTGEGVLACLEEAGLTPRIRKFVVWDTDTEQEFVFVNRRPAGYGTDPHERQVTEDISAQLPAKLTALREHRTQVELYCAAQTRPVVPEKFVARVCERPVETFWTTDGEGED